MTSIFDLALYYYHQIPSLYLVQFFLKKKMMLWNGKLTLKGYIRYVGGVGKEVSHSDGGVDQPGTQQLQQTYPGLELPSLQKNYIHFSTVDENCLYMYIKCYNITCSFNFYMYAIYMYIQTM